LGHIANPLSTCFRPLYLLVYRLSWESFGLHPLPYHLAAWGIHGLNTLLVFLFLKDFGKGPFPAVAATVFFAYQSVFREIFYNFACVGEPLCGSFFILGMWLYTKNERPTGLLIICWALLYLGLKAKEMAITLPMVWMLHDLILPKNGQGNQSLTYSLEKHPWSKGNLVGIAGRLFVPFLLVAVTLAVKTSDMGRLITESLPYSSSHPYFTDYSFRTLGAGYAWYFNRLLGTDLSTGQWILVWLSTIGLLSMQNNRQALFWVFFVFIAFVPVIGLVNRRLPYYWYIPILGLCGLILQLFDWVQQRVQRLTKERWAVFAEAFFFGTLCLSHFTLQNRLIGPTMQWVKDLTEENRNFIQGLRTLPLPPPHTTLFFSSVPRYFDQMSTKAAVSVALRRLDLNVIVVSEFPSGAVYRIRFDGVRLIWN
jgi:hypothetical protein